MRDEYEVVADERVNTEIHAKKLLWWRLTIYGFLAWIKYDTVWTTVVALYKSCFHQRNVNFILQASVVGVIRKVSWITVIILSDRMLYFIRTLKQLWQWLMLVLWFMFAGYNCNESNGILQMFPKLLLWSVLIIRWGGAFICSATEKRIVYSRRVVHT